MPWCMVPGMRFSLPLVLFAVACGSPTRGGHDPNAPDAASPDTCEVAGTTRCAGQAFQICEDGRWATSETCASDVACTAVGCGQCDPAYNHVCVGKDLYTCHDDGTLGGRVTSCGPGGCAGHACAGAMPGDCEGEGTQLVYLVDKDATLLSFDPRHDAHTFHVIGQLDCPAGTPWPAVLARGERVARPLSMAVDRLGRAWVLYTSGEIFWVSTLDASCQPSPFAKGDAGFELFGMGFVATAAGADSEQLFIAGGPDDTFANDTTGSQLGVIDPSTAAVNALGPLPVKDFEPELTGNGDAELWAYFPGGTSAGLIARLDKQSGEKLASYPLPVLGTSTAWAFAHHGGRFYLFLTTDAVSQVLRLDPAGAGQLLTVVQQSPYAVVGAGVSTCAPLVVE